MKRFALAGGLALACSLFCHAAFAANATNTPIVPPTETGEWSAMQQQVVDMARFKPGYCTLTAIAPSGSNSGTCNNASGSITVNAVSIAALATSTYTMLDSKVQAGDGVLCTIDATGAAAGTAPECWVHVTAGQIQFNLTNNNATTATGSVAFVIYFLLMTQGNPN